MVLPRNTIYVRTIWFFGLPGLILELTDDNRTYSATEISLNQSDYNIVKPKKGVIITQEEFEKLREKFKR